MKPSKPLIILSITCLLLIALGVELFLSLPNLESRVIFCDVGQGDGILITSGITQVLIDGGPDDKILTCLAKYVPWWDRQIELVVATHPDADHITGLESVLKAYQVQRLLATHLVKNTSQFNSLLEEINQSQARGMVWLTPKLNENFVLNSLISATLIWPPTDLETSTSSASSSTEIQLSAYFGGKRVNINSYNDGSIALLFVFGKEEVLLTGDLEEPIEKALLSVGVMNHVTILKVGHHGSKSASSQAWINKLTPEFSVISAALKNKFGHPDPEVISRLEKAGSQIFKTSDQGSLVFRFDGQHFVKPP